MGAGVLVRVVICCDSGVGVVVDAEYESSRKQKSKTILTGTALTVGINV